MVLSVPKAREINTCRNYLSATIDRFDKLRAIVTLGKIAHDSTVRALHGRGLRCGIVSSAVHHPFLEWTLAEFGIVEAFTSIVTSASAGFYKSRPEIYLHAAELLSARPSQMVHVGDSLRYDVGGASSAGMGTVWLQFPDRPGDGSEFVPDLTVTTLEGSAPPILGVLSSRLTGQAG